MAAPRCPKCGRPSDARDVRDWCSHCMLLLHDPWLTRRCPYCHKSVTRDVGQHYGGTPPGTGRWLHSGGMLPYGGPERAAVLVQHLDAGHPVYDLGARPDMAPDEYRAVVEGFRRRPEVQRILRRVAPQCLPADVPLTVAAERRGWKRRSRR